MRDPFALGGPGIWSPSSPRNEGSMSGNFSIDTRASAAGFGAVAWLNDLSRRNCRGGDVECGIATVEGGGSELRKLGGTEKA